MNRKLIPLFFTTFAVVLFLFGLLGPWYNIHNHVENIYEYDLNFHLTEAKLDGKISNIDVSRTYVYQNKNGILSLIPEDSIKRLYIDQVFDVFETTKIFVLFALLFSAITFISYTALYLFENKFYLLRNFILIMGVLFSGLSICGIIFFTVSWTSILHKVIAPFLSLSKSFPELNFSPDWAFWYSYTSSQGIFFSIGPGYAWYLMIVGGVCGLGAVVLTLKIQDPSNVRK
jgi:hypothetical protein